MISAIDNIGIAVSNLERSLEFYEKLGFTRAFANNRGCLITAGSCRMFVFEGVSSPITRREFDLFNNPPGIDHISFVVDDVDRTYLNAVSKGVAFSSPPADQPWGARAAMLRDPDGNNLYLLTWLKK